MPISRNCYFCSRKGKKEQGCTLAWCDVCEDMHEFTPNADWLYIEKLEKENEELKHLIKLMKCTRITS